MCIIYILGSSLIPSACRKRWLKPKIRKSETPSFSKCGMIKKCLPFQISTLSAELRLQPYTSNGDVTMTDCHNDRDVKQKTTTNKQQTNNKQTNKHVYCVLTNKFCITYAKMQKRSRFRDIIPSVCLTNF